MLVPPGSSSAVLVMIRSKSVSICNRSRASILESKSAALAAAVFVDFPEKKGANSCLRSNSSQGGTL